MDDVIENNNGAIRSDRWRRRDLVDLGLACNALRDQPDQVSGIYIRDGQKMLD